MSEYLNQMTRLIDEMQAFADRVKSVPTEPKAARKKYGASLIRVNWQYASVAFKRPELKHVCTWSDGDEGFVFRNLNVPDQTTASTKLRNGRLTPLNGQSPKLPR